jgi:hypothetical protein
MQGVSLCGNDFILEYCMCKFIGTETVLANLAYFSADGVTDEMLNRYSIQLINVLVEKYKEQSFYINVDIPNIEHTLGLYWRYFYAWNGRYFLRKKGYLPFFNDKLEDNWAQIFVEEAKKIPHENI